MKKIFRLLAILLFAAACSSTEKASVEPKLWLHRANKVEKARHFQYDYAGLEIDVHYNDSLNTFTIHHDANEPFTHTLDEWCDAVENVSELGIWFDFKNLSIQNSQQAANCLAEIRERHHLHGTLYVEGSAYRELQYFKEKGFNVSFYIPTFRPEQVDSTTYHKEYEKIQKAIRSGVTHISGYDYQYEFMKREFPDQPKLLWTVSYDKDYQQQLFEQVREDPKVEVLLVPNDRY